MSFTFHNPEENEIVSKKLLELEQRFNKAEFHKQSQLLRNVEKQHQHNEMISLKKQFKNQKTEESEFMRLKSLVEKSSSQLKKNKKRFEEKSEMQELKLEQLQHKQE